jgi:uncharacterized surface protein with fasciclin (FAS1) repeats
MKRNLTFLVIVTLTVLLSSCNNGGNMKSDGDASKSDTRTFSKGQSMVDDGVSAKNILQIAMASDAHTTLVAGVQATGLEDVLSNNGPLTVFAPTNAAFDKLPEGTLETLLQPENLQTLKMIIIYHAAPGTYKGDLLKDGQKLFVATGDYLLVEREGDVVKVNGSEILATIDATNGVIHVVDDVFLPPEK